MKILEIKNNLVKLSYTDSEAPILGRFIILSSGENSYVAQFVNLKTDTISSYAIARLMFTFTPEGVVDNYDGSVPNINSEITFLPAGELLRLLPIETPVKLGELSQQGEMLSVDISVFEQNFTVFVEKDRNMSTFISNCVRQLFRIKEKSVIADTYNLFEDYPKLLPSRDFKLPLNSDMMDYIFEYDLKEVDNTSKAVIQDIFYEVQQYVKTLDGEFLPIEKFVDVVSAQYKSTQMPELALLKNKLLKYRDAGIFADTKAEIDELKNLLSEKNCAIIDLKDFNENLQKHILSYIHQVLSTFDKFVYYFTPLNDENSDKKLLKQFLNNDHVFTTILTGNSYKYASELRHHAQNMIMFAPEIPSANLAAYNTFISKLNPDECIVEGRLTQGIPFIITMDDLNLDLTKDDVLGERCQFVPAVEELNIVRTDAYGNQSLVKDDGTLSNITEQIPQIEAEPVILPETEVEIDEEPVIIPDSKILEPISNIMEDDVEEDEPISENQELAGISEDKEVSLEEELGIEEIAEPDELQEEPDFESELTEDDLNFIENSGMISTDTDNLEISEPIDEFENSEDLPVYPADVDANITSVGDFSQGDAVTHPRYGRGVIEKIIKYGNKTLCSISFENVGRRLLDPSISELTLL